MDISIQFDLCSSISYHFSDGEMIVNEIYEDEPHPLNAIIELDDMVIGSINGYLLYNENDFLYRCDNISGDCEIIASTICKKDGLVNAKYLSNKNSYNQIFILDKIEINDDFRGKGIGSIIIKNLPKMLQYQFDAGYTIFLCASDYISADHHGFDSLQYKNGTDRLINFYKRFGFRVIKDNIMFWR